MKKRYTYPGGTKALRAGGFYLIVLWISAAEGYLLSPKTKVVLNCYSRFLFILPHSSINTSLTEV